MDPVEVFVADEQAEVAVDALRWVRLARMVLEEQGVRGDAELSMLFVDEKSIGDLNERFLGRDGPTDVLAFPMDDELIESGRCCTEKYFERFERTPIGEPRPLNKAA